MDMPVKATCDAQISILPECRDADAVSSVDRGVEVGILRESAATLSPFMPTPMAAKSSDYSSRANILYLFDQSGRFMAGSRIRAARHPRRLVGSSNIFHGAFIGALYA